MMITISKMTTWTKDERLKSESARKLCWHRRNVEVAPGVVGEYVTWLVLTNHRRFETYLQRVSSKRHPRRLAPNWARVSGKTRNVGHHKRKLMVSIFKGLGELLASKVRSTTCESGITRNEETQKTRWKDTYSVHDLLRAKGMSPYQRKGVTKKPEKNVRKSKNFQVSKTDK